MLACVVGDDELTLRGGRTTTTLRLEQYSIDYYHFKVYAGARQVGIVLRGPEENDWVTPFDLPLTDSHLAARLGGLTEGHFTALNASTFRPAVRQVLAHGPLRQGPAYFAPAALNDKGHFLQQQGYLVEAQLFLSTVVRRYPTRAVAYLNRGDTYWQLGQLVAAQADYRRYHALRRTQPQDTTRVPPCVPLALRWAPS
ncbi:hypothetical protein GCM10027422_43250 [Hymenobacter arcticus]